MIRHVRYQSISPGAREIYAHFLAQEGSQYIATPVTIQAILDFNTAASLSRVLEMGAGIGTLTYAVAKYTQAHIDTYEDNVFCIEALTKHLAGLESSYTLMTDYAVTPPVRTYDLVLIDGGGGKGEDGGTMPIVQKIARAVDARIFYIEGGRHQQRVLLRRALAERYVYSLTQYDGVLIDGVWQKGGVAIHCRPMRNALVRTLSFYYWELMEWTPVQNALMYRLRKLRNSIGL